MGSPNKTKKYDDGSVMFFNYDQSNRYYEFIVTKHGICRGVAVILTAKEGQKVMKQHKAAVGLYKAHFAEQDRLRELAANKHVCEQALLSARINYNKAVEAVANMKLTAKDALAKAKLQQPRHYGLAHHEDHIRIGCNHVPLPVAAKAVKLALALSKRKKRK